MLVPVYVQARAFIRVRAVYVYVQIKTSYISH